MIGLTNLTLDVFEEREPLPYSVGPELGVLVAQLEPPAHLKGWNVEWVLAQRVAEGLVHETARHAQDERVVVFIDADEDVEVLLSSG